MPEWWIKENPEHTISVPNGKRRESLYSDKFREDAAEMLRTLIEHFKSFSAKDHIIGYQISGGNTQEWFHLDLGGGHQPETLPFFNAYLKKHSPALYPADTLPPLDELNGKNLIKSPLLKAFLRFASEEVAETVELLCRTAKKATDNKQIVGVFYGYTALSKLLDSPYIDFFSSPNSYINMRALGIDWPDMMPADSLKLHGKMCFMECDIRTHLTRSPESSRKGSDPLHYYSESVWTGPPTEDLSVSAVRKSLARQLTHKHGLWWFDMFGHWFSSDGIMAEMNRSLNLYSDTLSSCSYDIKSEVAVFLDETAFSSVGKNYPTASSPGHLRLALGETGTPYSLYLLSDFDKIDFKTEGYKAVVFNVPYDDGAVTRAAEKLNDSGVNYIKVSPENPLFSTDELIGFYKQSGVFVFSETKDIFYAGNGFVALHAAFTGEKSIAFPEKVRITDTETGAKAEGQKFSMHLNQFETKLYKVEKEHPLN